MNMTQKNPYNNTEKSPLRFESLPNDSNKNRSKRYHNSLCAYYESHCPLYIKVHIKIHEKYELPSLGLNTEHKITVNNARSRMKPTAKHMSWKPRIHTFFVHTKRACSIRRSHARDKHLRPRPRRNPTRPECAPTLSASSIGCWGPFR